MFAVVQTGATTRNADIVAFKDDAGNRVPAILYTHVERAKCERRRKTLLRLAARITGIRPSGTIPMLPSDPALGVVEIDMVEVVKKPRPKSQPSANGTQNSGASATIPASTTSAKESKSSATGKPSVAAAK